MRVERHRHRRFHPRWFRKRTPIFWWLEKGSSVHFIVRELTSLGVAYSAVLLVVTVAAVRSGEAAYGRLSGWLASPWAIGWHALLLATLLYHSFTWLHLAPKAMLVKLGGKKVPGSAILAGHYAAWIAGSALVVWLLAGGR